MVIGLVRLVMLAVFVVVGAGAWLFASQSDYPSDIADARHRISAAETRTTPCGKIEFARKGDGPAILISHGAGGGFDQGLDLAGTLAQRGFQVIAVSRFGYLGAELPKEATAERQADVYACLLDALGIERVAVLGASAGGPSAMQFALRHSDRTRALILLVPAAYAPRPPGEPMVTQSRIRDAFFDTALRSDFLFWAATKVASRPLTRAILGTPPERVDEADPAERARVRTMLDHILPVSARRLGLINDAAVIGSLSRYDLERITAPTLAISLEDDGYGTLPGAKYTAEHVPNGRLLSFAHGGHLAVGHQAEIEAAILALLADAD